MREELDKRHSGDSTYQISSRVMKRFEEISKEIKVVLQSSATQKEDKRSKERDTIAAGACFNTHSTQEEGKKSIDFSRERHIE